MRVTMTVIGVLLTCMTTAWAGPHRALGQEGGEFVQALIGKLEF
jgi:hypothetical protein